MYQCKERIVMIYPNQPYANGQVVVMLFEVPPAPFSLLGDAMTVLISKPEFPIQYLQFPGGMVEVGETSSAAASREAEEETGVVASKDPNDLIELGRVPKQRFPPHEGTFDVVLMGLFNCDFSQMFQPNLGQRGNDGEELQLVRFQDVTTPRSSWRLANYPLFRVTMSPWNLELLNIAAKNRRLAMQN
jgi:8-oxo-dGTP pyrophosphatase MutT (NUDIX family)